MIKFLCKNCGQKLNVEDKHSGKRVKCPKCGSVGVVPDDSTTIKFQCQNCGQRISVPQIHAGKKGKCPKCKNPVVVPSLKKEPADGAGTVSVVCSMCNEAVQVPETSRGQTIECPECGSYIETSSGGALSGSDASVPPRSDEDFYQEETEEYEESKGVDRHLIVVISTVAGVVVVGLVILAVVLPFVLRSSGSRPVDRPEGLRGQQQVADTDSRPQPVTSDTQPTEPVVQEPPKKDALPEEPIVQEPPPSVVPPSSTSRQKIGVPRNMSILKLICLSIISMAIGSLIMSFFIRLATKVVVGYDISFGDAFTIGFLVNLITFLIRFVTAFINEPAFIVFLGISQLLVAPLIYGRMIDYGDGPIGFVKGLLIHICSIVAIFVIIGGTVFLCALLYSRFI